MKFLFFAVVFSLCTSLPAQDGENLAQVKEHAISNTDKRIGHLNELKSCISGAADKAAMKSCRDAHKAKRESMKGENKSWRESFKSERKSKREERKKQ